MDTGFLMVPEAMVAAVVAVVHGMLVPQLEALVAKVAMAVVMVDQVLHHILQVAVVVLEAMVLTVTPQVLQATAA
jgi:hypothetical protein